MTNPQDSAAHMASSALALARYHASGNPRAALPCPMCGASLDAVDLELHLSKAHPGPLPEGSGAMRITGVDKRAFSVLILLFVVWIVGFTIFSIVNVRFDGVKAAIIGVSLLVCVTPATAAALGAFKGQVELSGERLQLKWLFGLASRELRLPSEIESGMAVDSEMKSSGISAVDGAAKDVDLGAYLRISSGGRSITLAAKDAPQLGVHWAPDGWMPGGERRSWDLTVDRAALVALEYQLAVRGQLKFRDG